MFKGPSKQGLSSPCSVGKICSMCKQIIIIINKIIMKIIIIITKMKATTLPVVIGALGVIKKGMRSTFEKNPGKINLEELQKITLMGTAQILRKVLSTDL